MKIKKRILSIALAGAMVLGLMPSMTMTALAAEGDTSYTLTIPSTLSVANSGWNDTDGISATGTLADGKKLTVTARSANSWALKSGDNSVSYTLTTAEGGSQTTSWEFDSLSGTATTKAMGIIVDDYSSKPAGTYQDTVTFTAKVENANTPVTSITLNKTATEIKVGSTETLSVTAVTPDDATDKTVTWSSDNEAVATVNATTGEVTAVAVGTANITATANDGSSVTATCAVTVTPAVKTVTINQNDFSDRGNSFTKDGVTVSAEMIDPEDGNLMGGGSFSTTSGKFTKIQVSCLFGNPSGTGWSGSEGSYTWTGSASSVSFSGNIYGAGDGITIVCTIELDN